MDLPLYGQLLLVLLFVVGNAFFVGSEIAITSARRSRIKQLADLGNTAAKSVQQLHNEPERFYSVTQIGITLVSLGLGATGMTAIAQLTDPMFESLFRMIGDSESLIKTAHSLSYALAFVVISFLHVVGGELAPKVLAFHKAEQISMSVGWLINIMYLTMKPLIWVMNKASNALLWVFGQRDLASGEGGHFSMSEEEIRMILLASESEGKLDPEDTRMIRGVFDLGDHTVREAMVPRTDILALRKDATLGDALQFFKAHSHARFPVYEGNVDNIIGIVAMKELLNAIVETSDTGEALPKEISRPVGDFMHTPFIVPNSKPLSDLLKEFKRNRQQMAVVVDEYGGTEGIITLEDILEEIVGEYADEFTPQARRIKKIEGSQYMVDASMRVTDLEPLLNFPFPQDPDYITLGGLVYKHLGHIPKVGDGVELTSGRLRVVEMDNHRITKVLFQDLSLGEDGQLRLAESDSKADDEDHHAA